MAIGCYGVALLRHYARIEIILQTLQIQSIVSICLFFLFPYSSLFLIKPRRFAQKTEIRPFSRLVTDFISLQLVYIIILII